MRSVYASMLLALVSVALPAAAQVPTREAESAKAAPAKAESGPKIYRWTDSSGRVQFSSSPPPGTPTETVAVREQDLGGDQKQDTLDVVDRRNQTAPAPSYDWEAERPKRLAEHCGFIRERVKELRAGQEWIVLDWGKPPTRLDGPKRVEELVRRDRLLRQHCQGY